MEKFKAGKMIVYLAATFASLFWGYSYVWFKQVNVVYGPITIITLRLVVATLFLSFLMSLAKKHQKIQSGHWKHFFLLALLQPFLYFFCESVGLTMVTATTASIIVSTIPVFTPIFTHFISREYFGYWVAFGLLLSFVGVTMVVRSDGSGTNSIPGIILMFGAVASAIVYGLTLKSISSEYSSLTIVKYQNMIGLLYFIPIFIFAEGKYFMTIHHNVEAITNIIKLGTMPSTLSFIFITFAIRRIGLINTNIFANLIPVFTAVIAYIVLNDPLPLLKVLGILIVICGLFISQIPQYRKYRKLKKEKKSIK
ncbi:MAG: DMT family transporter [Candidatus Cloacimonetes bacterium]|nr:DMT family transporter [Candidatus Cloacimonadota bacterium]MCF7815184.1 DMT family transporter [Candidatus Cloacimonadota bacterium]MCF7867862.1 DMT family transporter [Candidatus Cloacimonadota bacterium]